MTAISNFVESFPERLKDTYPTLFCQILNPPTAIKASVIVAGGAVAISVMHSTALAATAIALTAIVLTGTEYLLRKLDFHHANIFALSVMTYNDTSTPELQEAQESCKQRINAVIPNMIQNRFLNHVRYISWIVKNFTCLPSCHRESFISALADLQLLQMQPFERYFIYSQLLQLDQEVIVEHMRNVAKQLGEDQKQFSSLPSDAKFACTLYLLKLPVRESLPPLNLVASAAVIRETKTFLHGQSLFGGFLSQGFKNWIKE